MALDKLVDSTQLDGAMTATANAIRGKTGGSSQIAWDASTGFANEVSGISTGTDVSDTTATAGDVLSGKYFYTAAGQKTQGSIASKTSADLTSSVLTVTAPAGHYASDASKTLTDANLVAGNIKNGVEIFGVTGSYQGGGGSNWTLIKSQEFTINTTSTTNSLAGEVTLDVSDIQDLNAVLWVHIRDKAGKRTGYFYGNDAIYINYIYKNGQTSEIPTKPYAIWSVNSSGAYSIAVSAYGVYARYLYQTSTNHYLQIYQRYSSSYGTINGTFKVDVYKLTLPSGFTMLE